MADKEITIRVSTEADTKEVEDLKQQLEALENTNIVLELDADKTPIDNAKQSTEDLQTAFEETTNTVDNLTQELANIELGISDADYETVNEALQEATEKADELETALQNLDSSRLQEADENAQQFSSSTQQAESDVENLADSMGLIESSMLMDMANQLGALGDQAEGMAQEMNTASITVGQLSTNVGMAEPKMVSLINYISNKTFPQEEAMAYVNALNQMGVSADKLGDSATNMDRINDATRTLDYNGVMQLTQGLRSVGIEADNLPSAFNAIAFAEANVSGGAGTLNQVLKRQASTINEYGLNVDQLVLIMQSLSEKGVQGMKMGSELSKVLKDNNGDIQAIEQSLGLQAGTLANASSETGKYAGKLQELADEEMEHKTFIDEINAGWEDMQLALAPVLSPLTSFIGLIGSFGQTALAVNSLVTLADTFGLLKKANLALIPSQIAEGTAGWFSIGWIAVAILAGIALGLAIWYLYENCEWFREGLNNLVAGLQWLVGVISGAVSGAIQWLMGLFQNFTNQLGLNTNDWIQAVLGFILFIPRLPIEIGVALTNALANALGFKGNFVQTLFQTAMNAVNSFASAIAGIPQALQNCLNWAYNLIMNHPIVQAIIWLGDKLAYAFSVIGLGQGSPGKIYGALENELDWSEELLQKSTLDISAGDLGSRVVGSFGNPNLTTNMNGFANNDLSLLIEGNSGQGDTYNTFNLYGDMDNEDRMKKFIEAVEKEINWNNVTAGRTI